MQSHPMLLELSLLPDSDGWLTQNKLQEAIHGARWPGPARADALRGENKLVSLGFTEISPF